MWRWCDDRNLESVRSAAGMIDVTRKVGGSAVFATLIALIVMSASVSSPVAASTRSVSNPTNLTGFITVSAAASLTGSFDSIGAEFERAHSGSSVQFNFGSSATLVEQIEAGAPADVFASASAKEMAEAVRAGEIEGHPFPFARNSLAIVVKPGNPLVIRSLKDLTKAHVVALCAPSTPCGAAATVALTRAHVGLSPSRVTLGQDVKGTLEAVVAGDADAGIVYVTDGASAGSTVSTVPIPLAQNVVTTYWIGIVKGAQNQALSRAWIMAVRGQGERVLRRAGFLPPTR